MINSLLAIIDRLIQLKTYQYERARVTYEQVFEPLFNDLLLIHGDYIKMFQDVADLLPWRLTCEVYDGVAITQADRSKAFKEAIRSLRLRRKQFEPIRVRLRALSNELAANLSKFGPEARQFIQAVLKYFPQGNIDTHIWPPSPSAVLLEILEQSRPLKNNLAGDIRIYEHARRTIEHNIRSHEETWSELCIAFAKLRVAVATSK